MGLIVFETASESHFLRRNIGQRIKVPTKTNSARNGLHPPASLKTLRMVKTVFVL